MMSAMTKRNKKSEKGWGKWLCLVVREVLEHSCKDSKEVSTADVQMRMDQGWRQTKTPMGRRWNIPEGTRACVMEACNSG